MTTLLHVALHVVLLVVPGVLSLAVLPASSSVRPRSLSSTASSSLLRAVNLTVAFSATAELSASSSLAATLAPVNVSLVHHLMDPPVTGHTGLTIHLEVTHKAHPFYIASHVFELPRFSRAGLWHVAKLVLDTDSTGAGSVETVHPPPEAVTFNVKHEEGVDDRAPRLVSWEATTGVPLDLNVTVLDDGSGVAQRLCMLEVTDVRTDKVHLFDSQHRFLNFPSPRPRVPVLATATSSGKATVDTSYQLTRLRLVDAAFNVVHLGPAELREQGFNPYINLGEHDVFAPVILTARFTQSIVDTTKGSAVVKLQVHADDETGVDVARSYVLVKPPTAAALVRRLSFTSSAPAATVGVVLSAELTLARGAAAGVWSVVSVQLVDAVNNSASITPPTPQPSVENIGKPQSDSDGDAGALRPVLLFFGVVALLACTARACIRHSQRASSADAHRPADGIRYSHVGLELEPPDSPISSTGSYREPDDDDIFTID